MVDTEYETTAAVEMKNDFLQLIISEYDKAVYEKADPRTAEWFLVTSPWPIITLIVLYLLFVVKIVPEHMENRKPHSLKTTIVFYNAFQIVVNAWLVYEYLVSGWAKHYSFLCEPVDYSRNPMPMRLASVVYYYFLTKIFDFSDTVFFVLRKKNSQVTFLHLFHHVSTLWLAWVFVKYTPGGTGTFTQLLNSAVHVLMYGYYLLSAMGSWIRPYLWWKKYLTTVQITQLLLVWLQVLNLWIFECDSSKFIRYTFLFIVLMDFILFCNFYHQSYMEKRKLKSGDELNKKGKRK